MKRKIKIISGVLLTVIAIPAFAADETANPTKVSNIEEIKQPITDYKGLGISGGAISGAGFSYRQFFSGTYGFKTSAVVYLDENQSFFNVGLQGMKELSSNDWLRFYLIGGISNFSFKNTNYIYPDVPVPDGIKQPVQVTATQDTGNTTPTTQPSAAPQPVKIPDPKKETVFSTYMNFGAGIGIEIGRKEQGLSLALELPLVISIKDFNKLNFIYPIPQISLIYNF
jgi:hypothetical protein